MDVQAKLTDEELAALAEAELSNACVAEPTVSTARLVALGLLKETPLGFYTTRAGGQRLASERLLRMAVPGLPPLTVVTGKDGSEGAGSSGIAEIEEKIFGA